MSRTGSVCSCVREIKGSWADIGSDRICLFGTGNRLSAQKRCDRCGGTGVIVFKQPIPKREGMMLPEPPPPTDQLPPDQQPPSPPPSRMSAPSYYVAVERGFGTPTRFEAEAPTALEARRLLRSLEAGGADE